MESLNLITKGKPEVKSDEVLCGACWKVEKKSKASEWHYMNFKHLEPQNICLDCKPEWLDHCNQLQLAGL